MVDETSDLAWRTLRRLGVPRDLVDDSFQKVFLIVAERIDDIEPGSERSFIYGVTLRIARTYVRSRGREVLGFEPDQQATTQPGPEAALDRTRLIATCDRLLGLLDEDVREVFILHELEGLKGPEIAGLLDLPEGTVHSRLRRARLRVRAEVELLEKALASGEVGRG